MKFKDILAVVAVTMALSSCNLSDDTPGNYYTFTGETVASFLEHNEDHFSDFIQILKTAELWGEMRTYGDYTCFAPTNEAFEKFYEEKGYAGVGSLTVDQCDTIARTHIVAATMFTTDLTEGALPYPNMLDRYFTYTCDSTVDETGDMKVVYRINKKSILVERDDTLQNGVLHVVDQVIVPSNDFLPDVIAADPTLSLFYEALVETHLSDSLVKYLDETYPVPGGDSSTIGYTYSTGYEVDNAIWPEKRYFKFTALVEPDSVFARYGITNLQELIDYVTPIYNESYPDDAGLYDNDLTDRRNPLNRFVSYHLFEMYFDYNNFNVTHSEILNNCVQRDQLDVEDFFETMLPHSVMRISSPNRPYGVYLNRKGGPNKVEVPGVRVLAPSESTVDQTSLNGIYHYIDDILLYDKQTREKTLNCRMRIMCTTLSPDFINSGARGRVYTSGSRRLTYGFKRGFAKNVSHSEETKFFVRYRDATFGCFYGDEISIMGIYDVIFKLPPVPVSGTYEVRIGYAAMNDRGVVQIYYNDAPCDIPLDLRLTGLDPKVGWVADSELGDEAAIQANEKAMHNRGYMKGMDSYNGSGILREKNGYLRRILCTEYLYDNVDNYIRIRLVDGNESSVCPFNVVEVVPKSIYAGDIPEDRH